MRTHFFISHHKDNSSQNIIEPNDFSDKGESFEESLIKNSANSLHLQKFSSFSPMEKTILNGYRSNLIIVQSFLEDSRFNPLKTPDFEEEEIPPCVHYEFFRDNFAIIGKSGKEILTLAYDPMYFPLLEPLETGIINPYLYCVLEKDNSIDLSAGKMFVRVVDYRYELEKRFLLCLRISENLINFFIEEKWPALDETQKKVIEKDVYMLKSPTICLDPSPDVARIKSLFDGNRKMWSIERERGKDDFKPYDPPPKKEKKAKEFKRIKVFEKITPPKIPNLFPDPFRNEMNKN